MLDRHLQALVAIAVVIGGSNAQNMTEVCYSAGEVTLAFNDFDAGELVSSFGGFDWRASNCMHPMVFDTANPTGGESQIAPSRR